MGAAELLGCAMIAQPIFYCSEARVKQTELIIAHLRLVLGGLGSDGGHIGPSVYDTAQALRLAPPAEGPWEALDWLIAQQ